MSLAERALSLLASVEATSARTTLEITLAALQGAAAVQAVGLASMEAKGLSAPSRCSTRHPSTPLRGLLLNGLGVVLWVRGELDEANVLAHRSEARGSDRRCDDAALRVPGAWNR